MWPEFRSVAQLSMIEMRIWGVKMLRQLSELHRRNLTKQVRRCQKDLFLQGEFFNSVQSFVLWKNWVQEEENQQRKEELRQAVAAVKRQLQDCPRENLVVFFPAGNFFFRFGGRKWKCPWVSWRWQMRWQWGDSKKTQVHCLLTSGHWMHSLPHRFQPCFAGDDQPTDQLGNEVPTGQLDIFSAKCRL